MRKDSRPAQSAQHRIPLLTALACVALGGAGCSTPGANHAYLAAKSENPIVDRLPGTADVDVPTFLSSGEELYGLAYDPFTDHLFLRIYPGDFVIVIDRPANRIKRSFCVHGIPLGRGDLAIRSSDRHLFFVNPNQPALTETNLEGVFVRMITLEDLQGPADGVAYDQKHDHILILKGGDRANIVTYDLTGKLLSSVALDRNVRLTSLAFDSVAGELYVPLADEPTVGVFSPSGRFLRSLKPAANGARDYVDVGPRSLLRLF